TSLTVRFTQNVEKMNAELVTGDYFRAAGIAPVLGRPLTPADGRAGANPVALASYGLWVNRYQRSPSILGSTVWLNNVAFTIVGVMPQGYQGMLLDWYGNCSFWAPLTQVTRFFPANSLRDFKNQRGLQMLMMFVRLHRGVNFPQLQAALDVLSARVEKLDYSLRALPANEARFWPGSRAATVRFLWMLVAISAMLLAIACFSLAGLLLARTATRQREIGVRFAVGAGRARVLQQLTTESLVLAALAAVLAIPVAAGITLWLRHHQIANGFHLALNLNLDWRALAVGAGVGLLTGALAGIVPAWRASHGDLSRSLRASRASLRELFIGAQVAYAMAALVAALLLGQSLHDLGKTRLGFDPRGILTGEVEGFSKSKKDMHRIAQNVLSDLRSQTAGAALARDSFPTMLRVNIQVRTDDAQQWRPALLESVSGGYFELLRIPVLSGRSFRPRDTQESQPVAIVNQTAARLLWPGENPVGHKIRWKQEKLGREVVGVVDDARYRPLADDEGPQPYLFIPLWQDSSVSFTVHVRTPGPPLQFAGTLRRIIAQAAPDLPVPDIHTLQQQVDGGLLQMQTAAQAVAAVCALAALLALAGIFAAGAYRIAQRKKEIAIRIAVGADPGRVILKFARRGFLTGVIGAGAGILPAIWEARLLRASIPGTGAPEVMLFVLAGTALVAAASAASWFAARRIACVQPADILRVQ
ncbi:MAG TPA: ABC transporter permease, partial [Bryobacteraceae bacterium]|nr:ABC transporter permease [Bryobacteraceae bacterium]